MQDLPISSIIIMILISITVYYGVQFIIDAYYFKKERDYLINKAITKLLLKAYNRDREEQDKIRLIDDDLLAPQEYIPLHIGRWSPFVIIKNDLKRAVLENFDYSDIHCDVHLFQDEHGRLYVKTSDELTQEEIDFLNGED